MKPNYIGIIGGILAFISLALPWWTVTLSSSIMELTYSADISVYLYQVTVSAMGFSMTITMDIWFGWVALALVAIGGLLGIVGSMVIDKRKMVLIIGGILVLLSLIIFAAGLQNELSKAPLTSGFPTFGLFSSGSIDFMEISMNYSSYLSFGFWLALVAAIIMFVAAMRKPEETVSQPPSSTPPSA